jgi:hypothetical protein
MIILVPEIKRLFYCLPVLQRVKMASNISQRPLPHSQLRSEKKHDNSDKYNMANEKRPSQPLWLG